MTISKLETYIEFLKAINSDGEVRSNRQNPAFAGVDFRRAIDFLVKQNMISRCDEKATYRVTQRGAAILNYFAPHITMRFEARLDNLEITE